MTSLYHHTQLFSVERNYPNIFVQASLDLTPSQFQPHTWFGMTGVHHCAQLWLSGILQTFAWIDFERCCSPSQPPKYLGLQCETLVLPSFISTSLLSSFKRCLEFFCVCPVPSALESAISAKSSDSFSEEKV
jgi:hypothetical protein